MTVQELENTLVQRLSRVFKNPQLSVRVQAFRSKRAYIEGEVRQPGLMVFTDIPMTLAEALNRAGGLAPNGDSNALFCFASFCWSQKKKKKKKKKFFFFLHTITG